MFKYSWWIISLNFTHGLVSAIIFLGGNEKSSVTVFSFYDVNKIYLKLLYEYATNQRYFNYTSLMLECQSSVEELNIGLINSVVKL